MFKNNFLKIFLTLCSLFLFLETGLFSVGFAELEYEIKTLFATIFEPDSGDQLMITAQIESAAIAEILEGNTSSADTHFHIQGVAPPDTNVSTHITTPIPEEISDFTASIGQNAITFRWKPRLIFNPTNAGLTPQVDPTKNATNSNIPYKDPLEYHNYNAITQRNQRIVLDATKPSLPKKEDREAFCTWTDRTSIDPDGIENSGDEFCQTQTYTESASCEYSLSYDFFWQGPSSPREDNMGEGPLERILPLDTGIFEYIYWYRKHYESNEQSAASKQQIASDQQDSIRFSRLLASANTIQDWNTNPLLFAFDSQNQYTPPVSTDTTNTTTLPNGTGGSPEENCRPDPQCTPQCQAPAAEKYPIENQYYLVNDFEHYEIWYNVEGDDQHPYLAHLGVARDDSISHKIQQLIFDPQTSSVTIPFSEITDDDGNAFHPDNGKIYHFSLFEVQRIDTLNTDQETIVIDEDTDTNDAGYFFVAKTPSGGLEIRIDTQQPDLGEKVQYRVYTVPKIEAELKNAQILTNNSGEFLIPAISFLTLNPASMIHSLVATYNSTDTRFVGTQEDNTFFIASQRDASFFKTSATTLIPPLLNIQTEPYGTVYDYVTKQPVPNVQITCRGKAVTLQGQLHEAVLTQNTSSDGYFSFYAPPGQYELDIHTIYNGRNGNFHFPIQQNCDVLRIDGDGIYSDIYCQTPQETNLQPIYIADTILHYDIPIMPTLYGQTDGSVPVYLFSADTNKLIDHTTSTPEGKFSFFVTSGNYTVAIDPEGNTSIPFQENFLL